MSVHGAKYIGFEVKVGGNDLDEEDFVSAIIEALDLLSARTEHYWHEVEVFEHAGGECEDCHHEVTEPAFPKL